MGDIHQCEEVSSSLLAADHTVLPANDVEEASEAISLQKFDAVLLGDSISDDSVGEFAAKLRRLERAQQSPNRTAIFCLSDARSTIESDLEPRSAVDGYLSKRLDFTSFTDAVSKLAYAIPEEPVTSADSDADLSLFELEAFQEQVGYDTDLLMEIIDLFMLERNEQIPAMRSALANGDYDGLGRMAHTIKGSLGSLHAARPRARAEHLEAAARSNDPERCGYFLNLLEDDIKDLEHELEVVRRTFSQR